MVQLVEDHLVFRDNMLRNRLLPPPGCSDPVWDDIVYHPYKKVWSVRYTPDHRPKPRNLLSSMTARPRVVMHDDTRGVYYHSTPFGACSHNGAHGPYTLESYRTDVSNASYGLLFDIDSLKNKNLWALRLREEMGAQQVNLGSSIAEYRESCKMFKDLADGLWTAYRAIRGRAKRRKITIRDVPASVLQYNFGVAPLVNDVYSSIEALKLRLDKPVVTRHSVSISRHYDTEVEQADFTHECKGVFSQRATVYVSRSDFAGINGDFDFGNPIEWAWELIPFSFVVDWAIPIGGWLGSLDAMVGINVISGTVTTKTSVSTKYAPTGFNRIETKGTLESKTYERDLISSVPQASLPRWEPSLSHKRAINATALLWLLSSRIR